eukprot:2993893-Pleurochrysis_carterae.AAC.5
MPLPSPAPSQAFIQPSLPSSRLASPQGAKYAFSPPLSVDASLKLNRALMTPPVHALPLGHAWTSENGRLLRDAATSAVRSAKCVRAQTAQLREELQLCHSPSLNRDISSDKGFPTNDEDVLDATRECGATNRHRLALSASQLTRILAEEKDPRHTIGTPAGATCTGGHTFSPSSYEASTPLTEPLPSPFPHIMSVAS